MSDWPAPDPGIAEASRLQSSRLSLRSHPADGVHECGREIAYCWHIYAGDTLLRCYIDWEFALEELVEMAAKRGVRDEC